MSAHYQLGSGPFEFINVHIDQDSRLFLDPSAIRRSADPYSSSASAALVHFFTEILRCARSNAAADQDKGLRLLQRLSEPNETRLGYSSRSRGHAIAEGIGAELWQAIRENRTLHSIVRQGAAATVQQAVMTRLEDLPLFINNVDRDLVSDLTTRIVFEVLVAFTQDMMGRYPSLSSGAATHTREVWDMNAKDLVERDFLLPDAGGALLLVPRGWVERRLIMNADAFYNRKATQVLQDETRVELPNGKTTSQSKRSIKAAHKDVKRTNALQAGRYAELHGRDLIGEYRSWTDINVDLAAEDEIDEELGRQD